MEQKVVREKNFVRYAAVTIVFSMVLLFIGVIMKVDITNVLLPILEEDYGWSRVDINTAISIGSYVAIALGFIAGSVAIKTGIKRVSTCGLALMCVGTFIIAFAKGLVPVSVGFALCQAAYPVVLLSAMTYVTKWFVAGRGRILGLATMAIPITSCIYVPLGNHVIAVFGKMPFYLVIALIIIAAAIWELFALRENPEDRGVSPDGIHLSDEEKKAIEAHMNNPEGKMTLADIAKTKEVWFVSIGNMCLRFMMVCLMSQFILRMVDVGMERPRAALIMSIATAIGIPLSFLWGMLDDRIGANRAITLFALTYVIGFIFIIFAAPARPVFIWLTALYIASAAGGTENLKNSIVSFVFGRRNYVSANRIPAIAGDVGSAFAFTFMTFMFARYGTYDYAYIVLIFIAIFCVIMYALIRKTYDPERLELNEKRGERGRRKKENKNAE